MYILITDQISSSDCLYFLRYWAICVLQLFVNHGVTSKILNTVFIGCNIAFSSFGYLFELSVYCYWFNGYRIICLLVICLVVSDLRSKTKGSWFESGCYLCAEVSSLQ